MPHNTDRSELELALSLEKGDPTDPDLIHLLVHRYVQDLFWLAAALLRPIYPDQISRRTAARDLLTSTFQLALAQIDQFQGHSSPLAWLCAALLENFTLLTRKQVRKQIWGWGRSRQPDLRTQTLETLPFAASLNNISEIERIPLLLHYGLGLSLASISDLYKKKPETIAAALQQSFGALALPAGVQIDRAQGLEQPELKRLIKLSWNHPSLTSEEMTALLAAVPKKKRLHKLAQRGIIEMIWIAGVLAIFLLLAQLSPQNVFEIPDFAPSITPDLTAENQIQENIGPHLLPMSLNEPVRLDPGSARANPYLTWQHEAIFSTGYHGIDALAFSPFGDDLAFGTTNSLINLMQIQDRSFRNLLTGHEGVIKSLAFSPDGALLASGDGQGTVRVWELPIGQVRHILEGHPRSVTALAFSPDSSILAVGSRGEVWLWDAWQGETIYILDHYQAAISTLSFSGDGKYLAVGDEDGIVWIERVEDGVPALHYTNHTKGISQVAFSPNGDYLVSASRDRTTYLVSLDRTADDKLRATIQKTLHESMAAWDHPLVQEMAFSPDGRFLATGLIKEEIHIWDTLSWSLFQVLYWGTEGLTNCQSLSFSADSKALAAGTQNGSIHFWRLVDVGTQVRNLQNPLYFERWGSDLYRGETIIPGGESEPATVISSLSVEEATAEAGFIVQEPAFFVLDNPPVFVIAEYDLSYDVVRLYYQDQAQNRSLQFSQMRFSDSLTSPVGFQAYNPEPIGLSAIVESIQLTKEIYAEFVPGFWSVHSEDNPEYRDWVEFEPGVPIQPIYRWHSEANSVRLRWQDGDFLFEIFSYEWPISAQSFARDDLISLATTILNPDLASRHPYPETFSYTVQDGDTCAGLADRFLTTTADIAELNDLTAVCDPLNSADELIFFQPTVRFSQIDLNCDGSMEDNYFLYKVGPDYEITLAGIAIKNPLAADALGQTYLFSSPTFLSRWEHFQLDGCEQMLVLVLGDQRANSPQTVILRWNETSIWPVLRAAGWPHSSAYSVSELTQDPDTPITIPLVEVTNQVYKLTGECIHQVTDYVWNGSRFESTITHILRGECP